MVGFYTPDVIVNDAKRHGLEILPPHVNHSQARCTVENPTTIRLGLAYVRGLGAVGIRQILAARKEGSFQSLVDFCHRTRLPRRLVENLIRAGAMEDWGLRRELLWALGRIGYDEELALMWSDEEVSLPALTEAELVAWEFETLGLTTGPQVMALYRAALQARGVWSSYQLPAGRAGERVTTAGLVVVRQRPPTATGPVRTSLSRGAKGPPNMYPHNCYLFITLEDEAGLIHLILSPTIAWHYQRQLQTSLLVVTGRLQKDEGVINIIVQQLSPLRDWLQEP